MRDNTLHALTKNCLTRICNQGYTNGGILNTLCSDRGTLMSIGSAFSFIQLNTSQATIFSQYMQRLCGVAFKGSVSTDHAVTHVLGNSASFRLYCSAFHPRRNLWRDQSLRVGNGRERLQRLHSWMAESSCELEGKYKQYDG